MMRALVAFNGDEYEVPAFPDPFNSEMIDYTPTIAAALRAHHTAHPLAEPLNLETLTVSVKRAGTEDRNPDVKVQLDRVGRTVPQDVHSTPRQQRRNR
jgi:hypothetical protein